ncbi:EAL domain-containing protein [Sulfurimonas sediminis]|uniref:EAL domain-containing protein n=2 Tax=Sulfurimonas sediminis TaxID=2590020 RepID=A0A7M1B6Q7_9BACT|nr:EAL domain-containing protein [Sulfurimonas sediminis]
MEFIMSTKFWEILLVGNDAFVHDILKEKLGDAVIFHKKLKVLHAHNAEEARKIIQDNKDIAVAFIDINIEKLSGGLQLINYIRAQISTTMRIVIIDSVDSAVPTDEILEHYDINDYRSRACIESQKFFLTVRAAIKQYQQFKDIQDKKDEIYTKMTTNEVTKLPNRLKLSENLSSTGKKSLILINIDDFSVINNHNGFDFGDKVLRAFSRFLLEKYTQDAQIFHLEADVFAMLYTQGDTLTTEQRITKVKDDIYNHLFSINGIKIHLTASIGVVLDDYGNIIQKAEFALKEARLYGKNNLKKYSDDLTILRTIHSNSLWTGRIRDALSEHRILTYFQPIKNLKTDKIEKYESLVRIEYEGEIYSPYHFLDAARYSGQLFEIFKIILEEACKKIQTSVYNFTVNISDYDLKHPQFMAVVKKNIEKYSISPERLTFEILENNSIAKHKEIQKTLNILHDLGCKLAIDDFGAECSNFGQLNNLKIDFIKIDGVFIKNIVADKNSQITAKTILDYAHQKNIPVIAEFVCSLEVYNYVKKMGIDYAQGYEISEPKPELS